MAGSNTASGRALWEVLSWHSYPASHTLQPARCISRLKECCSSPRKSVHMHSAWQEEVEQSEDRHGLMVAGKKLFKA